MSENKDEREHCESVIVEPLLHGDEKHRAWLKAELIQVLLCERAAAGKAEYERGRAEGFEHGRKERDRVLTVYLEQQEKVEDMAAQVREFQDRCNADVADAQSSLMHLQSRYGLLADAAREAEQAMRVAATKLQVKHGYEPLAIKECANVLRDLVDAALAETLSETEEKKT